MLPEPDCCNREKSEKEHQKQFSIYSGTVLQGRGLCALFSQREWKWKSNTMKYKLFHFFILMLLIYVLLLLVCPRTDPFFMLLVWEIWDIIGLVCI